MRIEHMFDDGESETGTAGFAIAIIAYPVKSFSNTGDIPVWDTNTFIFNTKYQTLRGLLPGDNDTAFFRRLI